MATHDYVIDNSTGANVRADINNVLQAILTNNSSSSAPSTTAAYMWWADTTNGILKIRNSANNAWVELLQLDGTLTIEDGSATTPGLAFRDDLNTGIYQDTNDELNIATAGVERLSLGASNTIFNEGGADVDFRIEGDTEANLFYVDAGNDRVGIGGSSPSSRLSVLDDTAFTAFANAVPNSTDCMLQISNNPSSEAVNRHASIQFGVNGGTHNRVNSISAVVESASNRKLAFAFCTDSGSNRNERGRLTADGLLLLGKTSGSFKLDIGQGSSSLVRLTNTLESSHGSHDANLVTGGTYYQNLAVQSRSIKLQTFNDSSVVNGFTLTPNQKALFGTYFSETTSGGANHQLNVQGTDHNTAGILAARFSADDGGPRLTFLKSRSASGGGVDKLTSGDTCGSIFWVAANNADLNNGFLAAIDAGADAVQGGADTPGRIRFFTTPDGSSTLQERMRILNGGAICIGRTSETVDHNNFGTSIGAVLSHSRAVTAASQSAAFYGAQGYAQVMGDGDLENTHGRYGSLSDETLKENIIDANSQWNDIKNIKVRNFNFKESTGYATHKQIGVIAQELETVCPNLVSENDQGIKAVASSVLYMKAVKALQEAIAKIEVLETKVATLEAA